MTTTFMFMPRTHLLSYFPGLRRWFAALPLAATLAAAQTPAPGVSAGDDYFENKVRPIFATSCAACHGQAESGGLRVDSRDALLKGGTSGPAIVPGNPDKSLLIEAVRQTGEIKMPLGGHLKPEQIADLAAWVKMGAPWPEVKGAVHPPIPTGFQVTAEQKAFWAFRPLEKLDPPAVKKAAWAKTPIDRFVLATLEHEGLHPVAPASRRVLLRRAYLDLAGLPPTREEVSAFEKDKSPDAFAKVVDRLLATPQYGERWGRHWLDVARYAEDDVRGLDPKGRGYMPFDGAYVFRDWVIKAFNDDMPYDFFVKAQLAGDLLDPKARDKALPGTALLGQGPWWWDQADPPQGRADERNERIDAVTRGFLGLTVACARCHDHKYDPISQRDYYALGGVFASTTYKEYPLASAAAVTAWQEKRGKVDKLQQSLREFENEAGKQYAEVLAWQTGKYMVAAWKVTGDPRMKPEEAAASERVDLEMLERWIKFLGKPQKNYAYLHDWQDMVRSGGKLDQAKYLGEWFQNLALSVLAEARDIERQNDAIKAKAGVKRPPMRDAYPNEFETKDQFCPGCDLELKTMPLERGKLYTDLFVADLDSGETEDRRSPGLFVLRGWSLEQHLSPDVRDHIAAVKDHIEELEKELPQRYPFVHGVADIARPHDIQVNLHGSPYNLGDDAPRRFLAVLSPGDPKPFMRGSGRLELADDIASSPLAARVLVNRVWKWHFGSGIVETPDNFGKMGDRPSNPELLEYLARHFVDSGMSIKQLQREIMLSAVYQLSADADAADEQKDPANRLYWRANRRRRDAEALRDSTLFVSGARDLKKAGGPSTAFSDTNDRRTVYCKVSRYRLSNFLQVFDFPNPSFTAEQRFSTTVPLQRLFFMNSSFVYHQAELLAKRVYAAGDDRARIEKAYELLFDRAPNKAELQAGLDFVRSNPDKPENEIEGEPSIAWKEYARVLLSSNEFEFVD